MSLPILAELIATVVTVAMTVIITITVTQLMNTGIWTEMETWIAHTISMTKQGKTVVNLLPVIPLAQNLPTPIRKTIRLIQMNS